MITSALTVLMLAGATPSFDCGKAAGVERVVCAEPRLAALDGRLAGAYARLLRAAPADAGRLRKGQRDWLRDRDAVCGKAAAKAPCLDGYYRSRIAALGEERRRREETLGHPPAGGTYAGFQGRWKVTGVTAGPDAGEITDFAIDEPRYMGLVLAAGPDAVRWLNGSDENGGTATCLGPSFAPRRAVADLPAGWKAVSLRCRGGKDWVPTDLTLKSRDQAEMTWEGDALLHLERQPPGAGTPPPPHGAPEPPTPAGRADEASPQEKALFAALQSAVRRHDAAWLAARGGLQVNRAGGGSYDYQPDEIREAYDWIITPEVARAILAQDPDKLARSWRGVMIGDGQVWIDSALEDGKWTPEIMAINQGPGGGGG